MKSLKFREKSLLAFIVIGLIGLGLFVGSFRQVARLDSDVMAAVQNPSPASPGYIMNVLPITGSYTTGGITGKVRFKMPWPATLIGISGIYRSGGISSTMSVDITEGGVSCLDTPLLINSTSCSEGVITDTAIADEAMISINTLVSGTGTFVDPTLQLIFKRK